MTASEGLLAVHGAWIANDIIVRANGDGAWREQYRAHVQALAESAALRAVSAVMDPTAASSLDDLLRARVKQLEAAGLVRAGWYTRAAVADFFQGIVRGVVAVVL